MILGGPFFYKSQQIQPYRQTCWALPFSSQHPLCPHPSTTSYISLPCHHFTLGGGGGRVYAKTLAEITSGGKGEAHSLKPIGYFLRFTIGIFQRDRFECKFLLTLLLFCNSNPPPSPHPNAAVFYGLY